MAVETAVVEEWVAEGDVDGGDVDVAGSEDIFDDYEVVRL